MFPLYRLALIPTGLALQVTKLETDGYFIEPLSNASLLDHYHSFLFHVNISDYELNTKMLMLNSNILKTNLVNNTLARKSVNQLKERILRIREILNKINYKRNERSVVNGLGSIIKFIAGNPDENDLNAINESLVNLFNNQKEEISRLTQFTSFANHITKRLSDNTNTLNENLRITRNYLEKFESFEDRFLLLQSEAYQADSILNSLLIIERTISLALNNIPNLEILSLDELTEIQNYLVKAYNIKQLLPLDGNHLFKLLDYAKLLVFGINQTITFLLKIPIVKPYQVIYKKIYPTPNSQDIIILPPKRFIMILEDTEYWTDEDCPSTHGITLCTRQPFRDPCTTSSLTSCNTAIVKNSYKLITVLSNKQILIMFRKSNDITEDCNGIIHTTQVQGTALLSSPCRLLIGTLAFSSAEPTFEIKIPSINSISLTGNREINLHLRHLEPSIDLQQEATELADSPIILHPITQLSHLISTVLLLFCLLLASVTIFKIRHRLHDLFRKPRAIITISGPDD